MEAQTRTFETIRDELINEHAEVTAGPMMSSPGIKYNGKVFAFLSKSGGMVFKLGKDFNHDDQDFEVTPFNPFKNKGPLAGWFEVSFDLHHLWKPLTEEALKLIQSNT